MSDLVPYSPRLPARGDTPGFRELAGRFVKLSASALALREGLWELRRRMEKNADGLRRVAELCRQAEVDPAFVAQLVEAAEALRAVAEASRAMVDAADQMEACARDVGDAHEREYRGIYERVRASGRQQPKPGFLRAR